MSCDSYSVNRASFWNQTEQFFYSYCTHAKTICSPSDVLVMTVNTIAGTEQRCVTATAAAAAYSLCALNTPFILINVRPGHVPCHLQVYAGQSQCGRSGKPGFVITLRCFSANSTVSLPACMMPCYSSCSVLASSYLMMEAHHAMIYTVFSDIDCQ